MPVYQYACTECGHDFEKHQSFTDPALTECPDCGGKLRKVFSPVGVVLKGSGFYRNDNRPKSGSGSSSDSSAKSSSDSSSSSASSSASSTSSSSSKSDSSSSSGSNGSASDSSTKSTASSGS